MRRLLQRSIPVEGTAGPAAEQGPTLVKLGAGSESARQARGQRLSALVLLAQRSAQPLLVFTEPVPGSLFFPSMKVNA